VTVPPVVVERPVAGAQANVLPVVKPAVVTPAVRAVEPPLQIETAVGFTVTVSGWANADTLISNVTANRTVFIKIFSFTFFLMGPSVLLSLDDESLVSFLFIVLAFKCVMF